MDTVSNCNRKMIRHFRETDEPFFGWSGMTSDQIWEMEHRYKNRPNPNRVSSSWNRQDGDETLGTYKSVWKR